MRIGKSLTTLAAGALISVLVTAQGRAADWWPFEVEDWSSGSAVKMQYVPLEKASKKWHLCALYPHLKDSWWVAINYGEVKEAERLGVKLTVLEAGGYTNLNKQISQFDDCVALGADAILHSVISEEGLNRKIEEGRDKGIVQIGVGNPIFHGPVDAKVFADQSLMGYMGGMFAVDYFKDREKARVVQFPGPQGSGWAEDSAKGFHKAVEGTNIEILEDKYGDTGKSIQLKLVEDALQAYDDIDMLFGVAVMAEVANSALDEAGLAEDVKVISWYSTQGMIDMVGRGEVLGTVTQWPVAEGRMGVDLAVRVLEGKEFIKEIHPIPHPITTENIGKLDVSRAFAVKGYQPVFTVD